MARFDIYAQACKFERSPGGWCGRSHNLIAKPVASKVVECRTIAQVDSELLAAKAIVGAMLHPGSFFVSARLLRGERAPPGFRQRQNLLECDRDTAEAA